MMNILVLECGLFPDTETLDTALETLSATHDIRRMDIGNLKADDDEAWAAIAKAIMATTHIITQ